MVDLTVARLQEFMIVLYALSLIFYFIDYLKKSKAVQRAAFWLIVSVWVTQTAILTLYIVQMKRFPVLSLVEGIYFYVWLLVTLSIVFQLIYKVNFMVFFMNIIGFGFLMIHVFSNLKYTASTVGDALVSEVLFVHITTAILSYAVFALAFVFAVLYLIVYNVLKSKKFGKRFSSLPNLHQTMMGMKMSIYTGIPILFVSLLFGVQWAYVALADWSPFDVKIMGSFAVLLIYASVVYFNYKGKLQSVEFAWMTIFAFLFTVVNFFLGSTLSEFHLWI